MSGIRSGVLSSVTVEVWRDFECRATRVRLNRADAVSVPTEYVGAITDCALDADDQLGALELAALGAQVAVDDANRRTREAEASEGRLLARVLAAEQRAEAAEAERDRMRPVVEAALMWSKWNPKHGLLAAIAAYRAGQPATSEAERIAATLVCSTCNDTHRMTLGDREVPCTRCPVPCETCRSRPVGAGPGAYCAGTPCGCPCHRAGAWRKP